MHDRTLPLVSFRELEVSAKEKLRRQAYLAFWGVAGAGTLGLILFVIVFGYYGERVTAGIDHACAEAAFQSGKKYEALGNYEQAVLKYRQALDGRFGNKGREHECAISLGDLLYKQGRYAEAIEAYRGLPEEAFAHAGTLTGYVSALQRNGDLESAERWGKDWLAKAQAEQHTQQTVWANLTLGRICHETGRLEQALAYYRAALALDPACEAKDLIEQIPRQERQ